MKKIYEKPYMEIFNVKCDDIIRTSLFSLKTIIDRTQASKVGTVNYVNVMNQSND